MPSRPQPRFPEPNTKRYWEEAQKGKLAYQTCDECKAVVFTPRLACTTCGSLKLSWQTSKGEGEVYTYSVVRQSRNPAFAELGAYVLAYIDLDEGFRVLSNVVGLADPMNDVKVGQRVKVEFEKQDSGPYPIPVFRPV